MTFIMEHIIIIIFFIIIITDDDHTVEGTKYMCEYSINIRNFCLVLVMVQSKATFKWYFHFISLTTTTSIKSIAICEGKCTMMMSRVLLLYYMRFSSAFLHKHKELLWSIYSCLKLQLEAIRNNKLC